MTQVHWFIQVLEPGPPPPEVFHRARPEKRGGFVPDNAGNVRIALSRAPPPAADPGGMREGASQTTPVCPLPPS